MCIRDRLERVRRGEEDGVVRGGQGGVGGGGNGGEVLEAKGFLGGKRGRRRWWGWCCCYWNGGGDGGEKGGRVGGEGGGEGGQKIQPRVAGFAAVCCRGSLAVGGKKKKEIMKERETKGCLYKGS